VSAQRTAAAGLVLVALLVATGCGTRARTAAQPARLSAAELRQAFRTAGLVLDRVPPLVGQPPAYWVRPASGRAVAAALVVFPSRESIERSVLPAGELTVANVRVSFFGATLAQRRRILAALLAAG
jgi:hypothetical protein